MTPRSSFRTLLATATAGGLVLAMASPASAAAAGSFEVVDRETVRAMLDADGTLRNAKLLEQLTVLGTGTLSLLDPTSGKGVRDLDGFSAPAIRDGKAVYDVTVDGRKDLRTLSDFTGTLPVTVKASYQLNGKDISPSDLVGRSGDLDVTYTVTNVTATPTELTFKDSAGKTVTKTVGVVVPFVGKVDTTLPGTFSEVLAPTAAVGGDGRGGTGLSFNMVLFPPIGAAEQVLHWSARVTDAVVPAVDITVLPASSKRSEVVLATASYAGGATSAGDLANGAEKIDANLLKLQEGAGQLLDGLTQLATGAAALRSGLADTAAPGAGALADGLAKAQDGSGALAGGLGTLADGNGTLAEGLRSSTGAADLTSGAESLANGLVAVRDGIESLVAVDGLPVAVQGLKSLLLGLDHPIGATGPTDPGGLLQGLQQIAGGLSNPLCNPAAPTDPANPCGVQQGLEGLLSTNALAPGLPLALAGVQATKADLTAKLTPVTGKLAQLNLAAQALKTNVPMALDLLAGACSFVPVGAPLTLTGGCAQLTNATAVAQLKGAAAGVGAGVPEVIANTEKSLADVTGLEAGLTRAVGGVTALHAGVVRLAAGSGSARDSVATLVIPGVEALLEGLTTAVDGISGPLAEGVGALADGSATLSDKLGDAADGADQLAAGSTTAATGAASLNDGLSKLEAGSQKLATGLDTAATGAGRLAEGLDKAAPGAQKIEAGTGKLSREGTSVLATKGAETQAVNAEKAATLEAMGRKVASGALPYGAPDGAVGTAVYKLQLAAATTAGDDNTNRGLAALGLLLLAGLTSLVLGRRAQGR